MIITTSRLPAARGGTPVRRRPRLPATGRLLAIVLSCALLAGPAAARDIWVGPGPGQGGDGSEARPYAGLDTAFERGDVRGGDRILLLPGAHGTLSVRGRHFDPPVTIASAPGRRAHGDMLRVGDSSGLILADLDLWPRPDIASVKTGLVIVGADSHDIVLSGLDIRSREAAAAYLDWDEETWRANSFGGVRLRGARITLRDSRIRGVTTAISVQGPAARVIGNMVAGFAKDGMRVFGEGSEIRGNTVKDCVKVNGNHDDALQSWARRGNAPDVVRDITVAQNRFIEWTGPRDHPLRCRLQGIGLFNGPYENWVIENNLIAVRTWHGMAIGGMSGAVIRNNTVVNIDGIPGRKPWIKLGKASRTGNNIITGNVAMGLVFGPELQELARQKNFRIQYPARLFEDPAALDFRPKAGSPLIDSPVLTDDAPRIDIDGVARPQGRAPDMGAFERPF